MKTPVEIKNGLENCFKGGRCVVCPYDDGARIGTDCINVLLEDLVAYIRQLEAQVPKWISVDDRLPENTGKYIVCTAKGSVYCAKFSISTRYSPSFHADMNTHITHWMPLPEQPKEAPHE